MSLRDLHAGRSAEVTDPVNSISNKLQSLKFSPAPDLERALARPISPPTVSSRREDGSPSHLGWTQFGPPSQARTLTPMQGLFGAEGQWTIAHELPKSVLAKIRETMPVHSVHERLLDMIPRDDAPLPSQVLQAPKAVVTKYFWLLDLRDRLWAESKVLEDDARRRFLIPKEGPEVQHFISKAIDRVSDGLLYIEGTFPVWASNYRLLEQERFLLYDHNHPLVLIQPYLVSILPPLPDYTIVDYAAALRRKTFTRPYNNIPTILSPRVAAH